MRLTLFNWRSTASSIQLEWLGDTGPTALRVLVAGQVVLDDELAAGGAHAPGPSGEVGLPPGLRDVEIPVEIHAARDRSTPRLLGIRLLSAAGD